MSRAALITATMLALHGRAPEIEAGFERMRVDLPPRLPDEPVSYSSRQQRRHAARQAAKGSR